MHSGPLMAFHLVVALIALIAGAPLQASEIYKWVDERGGAHYGDNPTEDRGRAIELDSAATGVDLAPSVEDWQASGTPQSVDQAAAEQPAAPSPTGPKEDHFSCFSSVEAALGPRSEHLAPGAPVPLLTEAEQERIVALLESTLGFWNARVTETQCLGTPEQPEPETQHEEGSPEIDWPLRGPWRLQATLDGTESGILTHSQYKRASSRRGRSFRPTASCSRGFGRRSDP